MLSRIVRRDISELSPTVLDHRAAAKARFDVSLLNFLLKGERFLARGCFSHGRVWRMSLYSFFKESLFDYSTTRVMLRN